MVDECSVHCPSSSLFCYTTKFRSLGLISSSGGKGERKLNSVEVKVEVKFSLEQAAKARGGVDV